MIKQKISNRLEAYKTLFNQTLADTMTNGPKQAFQEQLEQGGEQT